MGTMINFNEYRFKTVKKNGFGGKPTKRTGITTGKNSICKGSDRCTLVSEEWRNEYMNNRWGLRKLIYHVIEQCGYINCEGKRYVFEEVKKDVRYYQMCPQIENKRYKAPLWVKVSGEWYFIEVMLDDANWEGVQEKFIELGNYAIKGFYVDLSDIMTQTLRRMMNENDITGAAKIISNVYEHTVFIFSENYSEYTCLSCLDRKSVSECHYKPLELDPHEYAILEGTELKTGEKHLVLLYDIENPKKYIEYYKKQYKDAGIPLFYGKWYLQRENWTFAISHQGGLDKRLKAH